MNNVHGKKSETEEQKRKSPVGEATASEAAKTTQPRKVTPIQWFGRVAMVCVFFWTLTTSLRGFRALFREVPTSTDMIEEATPELLAPDVLLSRLQEGGEWESGSGGMTLRAGFHPPSKAGEAFARMKPTAALHLASHQESLQGDSEWNQLSQYLLQTVEAIPHREFSAGEFRCLEQIDKTVSWKLYTIGDSPRQVVSGHMIARLSSDRVLSLSVQIRPDEAGIKTTSSKTRGASGLSETGLKCEILPFSESTRCLARRRDARGSALCELAETFETPDELEQKWKLDGYRIESAPRRSDRQFEIWCSRGGEQYYVWGQRSPNDNSWVALVLNLL